MPAKSKIKKQSKIMKLMSEKLPRDRKKKARYYPTEGELFYWFNVINREIFDNALCVPEIMEIGRTRNCWGYYSAWNKRDHKTKRHHLKMNTHFKSKKHFVNTLSHEMVHHYQWLFHDKITHGQTFTEWYPVLSKFKIRPHAYHLTKEEV